MSILELGEYYDDAFGKNRKYQFVINNPFGNEDILIKTNSIINQEFFIDYSFNCTNDSKHLYKMILAVKIDNEKLRIRKIGQYPENTVLGKYKSADFEKILKRFNDSFVDYQNAEKSNKYNLFAGAYDYLRRVYEKMIKYYLKEDNLEELSFSRAEDKINSVKHHFEPRIQQYLNQLYSALSFGVHTLDEETCKEHYDNLKAIIDVQLQFEKSRDEVNNQLDESRNTLAALTEKYNKEKKAI